VLDFTKVKKNYLNVKLTDGTTILIGMPTKRQFDDFSRLNERLTTAQMNDLSEIEEIYNLTASIMSRNKAGKEISPEYIADIFDIEDIVTFYNAYVEFVGGNTASPN